MGRFSSFIFSILIFSIISLLPKTTFAYYTNMSASVVLGQKDFSSNTGGLSQTGFSMDGTSGIFVDSKGRLIFADHANNRVLIWNSIPKLNNTPADLVLGQPDFVSNTANNGGRSASTMNEPKQVYSDGNRLFVADRLNGRVLIWNTFPTRNGQPADVVVGQLNFTSTSQVCDQSTLDNRTAGVWVHNNKLLVLERNQVRVLIWNSVPTTNGMPADIVLGHSNFTTCSEEVLSATSIGVSTGALMVDPAGRLYVADSGNHRVLIWNSVPSINNTPADLVIGQPDFISNSSGAAANRLNTSVGNVFSNGSRVFVTDVSNHRVLIFNSIPTSNDIGADIVLGQPNFSSSSSNGGGNISSSGFNGPGGIVEYGNKLIVVDDVNNRILIFNNTISDPRQGISSIAGSQDSDTRARMRVEGTVRVDGGNYNLWKMEAAVNGGGWAPVTDLSNSVQTNSTHDPGSPESVYATYFHEFEPWSMDNGTKDEWITNQRKQIEEQGYTLKLKAYNNNADSGEALLYFEPFKLNLSTQSATSLTQNQPALPKLTTRSNILFSVNKYQRNELKENLDHYEVWVRKTQNSKLKSQNEDNWQKYIDKIPVDYDLVKGYEDNLRKGDYVKNPGEGNGIYENKDIVVEYTNSSSTIKVRKKGKQENTIDPSPGIYELKVTAVDKHHHTQDTKAQKAQVIGSSKDQQRTITTDWFPLQINSVSQSQTGIISSFNQSSQTSFTLNTVNPTFKGIAFTDSKITLTVTDPQTSKALTYTTTAVNSQWSIRPTLFPNSLIDIWVEDTSGRYNELPTLEFNYTPLVDNL